LIGALERTLGCPMMTQAMRSRFHCAGSGAKDGAGVEAEMMLGC